jgi:hypothetical protein
MKKNKLLVLGLIALMLAGGLVLASCGRGGCEGKGTCEIEVKKDMTYQDYAQDQIKGSACSDQDCAVTDYITDDGKFKKGTYKCDC